MPLDVGPFTDIMADIIRLYVHQNDVYAKLYLLITS